MCLGNLGGPPNDKECTSDLGHCIVANQPAHLLVKQISAQKQGTRVRTLFYGRLKRTVRAPFCVAECSIASSVVAPQILSHSACEGKSVCASLLGVAEAGRDASEGNLCRRYCNLRPWRHIGRKGTHRGTTDGASRPHHQHRNGCLSKEACGYEKTARAPHLGEVPVHWPMTEQQQMLLARRGRRHHKTWWALQVTGSSPSSIYELLCSLELLSQMGRFGVSQPIDI